MEYVRLVWRQCLADGTNLKTIPTLEEQDAVTRSASSITDAATLDVVVPVQRASSSPVVPVFEEYWTMGDLVEANGEMRVGVKRRLRGLQKLCRVKRPKVLKSVVHDVDLSV